MVDRPDPYDTEDDIMGAFSDKIRGRVKQATGALTGDDSKKREGEYDEHKGEAKGKVNDAVDAVEDKADDLRDQVSRA